MTRALTRDLARTLRGAWSRRGTLAPLLALTTVVVAGVVAVLGFSEAAGTSGALAAPLLTAQAKPVLVPGDPERLMRAEREANGVPIDDTTWEEILAAGDDMGFGRNKILHMSA